MRGPPGCTPAPGSPSGPSPPCPRAAGDAPTPPVLTDPVLAPGRLQGATRYAAARPASTRPPPQPWRLWGERPQLLAPRRQGVRASSESLGSRTRDGGREVKVGTPGTVPVDALA